MSTPQTPESDAIRTLVAQLAEGWNTKDAALFAQPFADDADFVAINGMHIQGQAQIERAHQHLFTTLYQNSIIQLELTHMRWLRPDVALVHCQNHNRWTRGEQLGELRSTISCVVMQTGERWAIAAFQNTRLENPT